MPSEGATVDALQQTDEELGASTLRKGQRAPETARHLGITPYAKRKSIIRFSPMPELQPC